MITTNPSNTVSCSAGAGNDRRRPTNEIPRSEAIDKPVQAGTHEVVLSRWWEHAGLYGLGALVEALLEQSIELSEAHLRLQRSVQDLNPDTENRSDVQRSTHLAISAMAEYQMLRIKIIGRLARTYVRVLSLTERLSNLGNSIGLQQAIADRMVNEVESQGCGGHALSNNLSISDLDATRERLRGAREHALLDLCKELSEPLYITHRRVIGQMLPDAPPAVPGPGPMADLETRRPDVLAAYHVLLAEESTADLTASVTHRLARLALERVQYRAANDVERAMRAMRARLAELVPIKACSAAAEVSAKRAYEASIAGRAPISSLAEASYTKCARRDREIEVRTEAYLNLIDLFETLGGGWDAEDVLREETDEDGLA